MMRFQMRSASFNSPFRWDPWQEIDELRRKLERISERSVERTPAGTAGLGFVPAADLYDLGAAVVVRVDLPGVKEGDLEIIAEQSTLIIRGQRETNDPRDERYLFWERPAGRFARTIELPASVAPDRVEASLKLGVLEITLPKSHTGTVKQVVVALGERG